MTKTGHFGRQSGSSRQEYRVLLAVVAKLSYFRMEYSVRLNPVECRLLRSFITRGIRQTSADDVKFNPHHTSVLKNMEILFIASKSLHLTAAMQ